MTGISLGLRINPANAEPSLRHVGNQCRTLAQHRRSLARLLTFPARRESTCVRVCRFTAKHRPKARCREPPFVASDDLFRVLHLYSVRNFACVRSPTASSHDTYTRCIHLVRRTQPNFPTNNCHLNKESIVGFRSPFRSTPYRHGAQSQPLIR